MHTRNLPVFVLAVFLAGCATSLAERLGVLAVETRIVVAHRGDSGAKPENTIPAFASALANGADMVELDFYQTKDGVLVCFHDGTLDRTTDAISQWKKKKARIADYTLAELQTLDAGAWKEKAYAGTRIPTLESALQTIQKGAVTMIEHKAGEPRMLVSLLQRLKLVDEVLVQSFNWKFLTEVHRLEPRLMLAVLGGSRSKPHPVGDVLREIQGTGAAMVHWNAKLIRREDVRALHGKSYLVCVYTVDSSAEYDRVLDLGVDAITTNYPGRLRKHIKARSERPSR